MNCFAALLLVPRPALKEEVTAAVHHAKAIHGFEVDLSVEPHREYVAEWIGRETFGVSGEVILRRGWKDNLWPNTLAA